MLWFIFTVIGSFLFWCALALIVDQNIIADELVYDRERNGFLITIGFVYFIRLNAWSIEQGGKKLKRKMNRKPIPAISATDSGGRRPPKPDESGRVSERSDAGWEYLNEYQFPYQQTSQSNPFPHHLPSNPPHQLLIYYREHKIVYN